MIFSKQDIKDSLRLRRDIAQPQINWLTTLLAVGVVFYILIAIAIAPYNMESHFVREDGAVTILSAIFMAMACGFAAASFYFVRSSANSCRLFWLLAACVLGFFALDELLAFHERVGMLIAKSDVGQVPVFRNWNDVIVIGYGVCGVIALMYFLPEVLKYPKFLEMLLLAFALYCLHTFIDSTQEPKTTLSVVLEESAKLFCSLFLAMSMFIGLVGVVGKTSKDLNK